MKENQTNTNFSCEALVLWWNRELVVGISCWARRKAVELPVHFCWTKLKIYSSLRFSL